MAEIPKLSSRDKPKTTKRPPTTVSTRSKTKRSAKAEAATLPEISPELRRQMIQETAYLLAEQRGFANGDPVNDWLTAEKNIDQLLAERATPPAQ